MWCEYFVQWPKVIGITKAFLCNPENMTALNRYRKQTELSKNSYMLQFDDYFLNSLTSSPPSNSYGIGGGEFYIELGQMSEMENK